MQVCGAQMMSQHGLDTYYTILPYFGIAIVHPIFN